MRRSASRELRTGGGRGGGGGDAGVRRLYVNGRFLTQKVEGVQRAAQEIVQALDRLIDRGVIDASRWRITVVAPRRPLRSLPLRNIRLVQAGRLGGHLWEQLELPLHVRAGLLLSLCNAAPLLKRRHVATLYDAVVFAAPMAYSRLFSSWYRILYRGLGRTAHTVLTGSRFSRTELARRAGIPPAKLRVVRLGARHVHRVPPDGSVLERHGLNGERFVLAVGSRNPNKNFEAVLRAMRLLPEPRPRLVVAGGVNPRVFRDSGGFGADDVVQVGYVSDAELTSLYSAAAAFVFPSLYEGFGFPPLEAMTCDCPAVVSDIPPLREVCGDAAAYFDPLDPADMARALSRVLDDGALATELRARGAATAALRTWDRCAMDVWEAVRAASGCGPDGSGPDARSAGADVDRS